MKSTVFATFGSGQLIGFNVNPMSVILVAGDEANLRQRLREEPFNNNYFTTYPIAEAQEMKDRYGMVEYTLNELLDTKG